MEWISLTAFLPTFRNWRGFGRRAVRGHGCRAALAVEDGVFAGIAVNLGVDAVEVGGEGVGDSAGGGLDHADEIGPAENVIDVVRRPWGKNLVMVESGELGVEMQNDLIRRISASR